ncbi:pleiotropic drug resistance protein 3-like [Gossypium australe]|uniref:Pleiotropic drug resistance protein 3-like n=1 Tax=Gossypium australe TaxID=47621 RepID=A0A5B6U348_9ROSI|nr:pleiotropic drug resistance protein 3-like [Gossypium australe]
MSFGSFTPPPPPIFVGENYQIWVVKLKMYLQAYDLWKVESDREPPPLRAYPTIAQIRQHNDEATKKYKALSCLQNDKLKEEFHGTEKTRQQQLLNLMRDFENLKMKKTETIKQYADKIMSIVNNTRLLGNQFNDRRIVEKVITTLPEMYKSKISSLEDLRDLITISLSKLINALYDRSKEEGHTEGAYQERNKKSSCSSSNKGKKKWNRTKESPKRDYEKKKYPPCSNCKKMGHSEKFC